MMRREYGQMGKIKCAQILCVFLVSLIASSCGFLQRKELVSYLLDGEDYYVTENNFQCFSPQAMNEVIQVRIEKLQR